MDIHHYVGIDISKATLDWAVYDGKALVLQMTTSNTIIGIKTALRQLKKLVNWNLKQAVFCMEHTGIYNAHLLEFLHKASLPIWLENSTQIKQAGGMQRGKSDVVDAQRIAEYAYRFRDQMRLWEPPRQIIQQLSFLSTVRQRLIQAYNLLAGPLAEQESFVDIALQKQLRATSKKSLAALKAEQKAINQQIETLIQSDSRLKALFELIVSVPGVGPATATEILVATNELKVINDPKKMAAWAVPLSCGCCPF
jgi:transposase